VVQTSSLPPLIQATAVGNFIPLRATSTAGVSSAGAQSNARGGAEAGPTNRRSPRAHTNGHETSRRAYQLGRQAGPRRARDCPFAREWSSKTEVRLPRNIAGNRHGMTDIGGTIGRPQQAVIVFNHQSQACCSLDENRRNASSMRRAAMSQRKPLDLSKPLVTIQARRSGLERTREIAPAN
jgi:hypothetical protein